MNKTIFQPLDLNIFSDETDLNYPSNLNMNTYKKSNESNSSFHKTSNTTYLKISFNPTGRKKQKNGASFCLNLIPRQNKKTSDTIHNYTQNIKLHSIKSPLNIENNKKSKTQKIILKSFKKEQNLRKIELKENINIENDNNRIDSDDDESDEKDKTDNIKNGILFDRNNIIRVIVSSEKIIKNFPTEYINEMIIDICYNLLNNVLSLDKIKINNFDNLFDTQDPQNFFEIRKIFFNFLLQISFNSPISESTLFLSYTIFDRYLCSTQVSLDDVLLITITSLVLAVKYNESSEPNFDDLVDKCGGKFSKEELKKCELNVMEKLDNNLSIPTIFDLFQFIKIIKYLTEKEYYLGLFVLEMYVINGGNLKYNPITIIEAVYRLIKETNGIEIKNLILYNYLENSGISVIKYEECVDKCLADIMNDCLNVKNNNDYTFLINKFSDDKYQKISYDFQLL